VNNIFELSIHSFHSLTMSKKDQEYWENFKRQTIHLNRSRTEEERIQVFRAEAMRNWNKLPKLEVRKEEVVLEKQKDGTFKEIKRPARLVDILGDMFRPETWNQVYAELINDLSEKRGIFPKKWTDSSLAIREELLKVRLYDGEDIATWHLYHCQKESEVETYVSRKGEPITARQEIRDGGDSTLVSELDINA